jgi:hypothetical protein
MSSDVSSAALPAQDVLTAAHPWVRRLLRLGFVARGVLYSLIGLLTLWSIVRSGEKAHGGLNTTFISIQALAPGMVLLAGLAVGFAGFAVGMFWTAIFDWNFHGAKATGMLRRAGCVVIGLVHLSLAASTLLLAAGHQPQEHGTRRWTELALRYPFGREGVAIGGLYAIGYGVFLVVKVWTGNLDPLLDLSPLTPGRARFVNWVGRFGMFSRGVIYVTIGVVVDLAAWRGDASNVVGIGGAMRKVSEEAYGAASLAVVASGLVAYGLFMFAEARYRRMGQSRSAIVRG